MVNARTFFLAALALFLLPLCARAAEPAQGPDLEHIAIQQEDIAKRAGEYAARFKHLEGVGYGGATLRRDLGDLADGVAGRLKDLEELRKLLGAGEETPAGKATIAVRATRETYDGPPLEGKAEVGAIVALQADVDIPGDASAPPSSYLTWQLFDADRRQVGDYFKQTEVYETGKAESRVRFLLKDLPPGDYFATLTHQFSATPDAMSQGFVRFALDRPVYIVDAWVADAKDGPPLTGELEYGKPAIFYVTFKLEAGVDKVNVALRAREGATDRDIALQTADYERKPDRDVQRIGMLVQPHALASVDGVSFTAVLRRMDGDNFGPAITAEAAAVIRKPVGKAMVSLPDPMVSGQMYRLNIGVPSDFKPPFTVEIDAGGMRFKPSSDPLRGTVKGFASDAASTRVLKVAVTDARGFRAEGGAVTTVVPKEVAEPKSQPTGPMTSSGGGSGGGSAPASLPGASGPPGDEQTGKRRIEIMVEYLKGLCPACSGGALCDSAMLKVIKHVRSLDPAVVGGMSDAEARQGIRRLASEGAQLYVRELRELGDVSSIKYCAERTFGQLEDEGLLPDGTGDEVIASLSGGGGGSGGSGQGPSRPPSSSPSPGGNGGGASKGYICVEYSRTNDAGKTVTRRAFHPNDAQGQSMARNGRITGVYPTQDAARNACESWSSARGVHCGSWTR